MKQERWLRIIPVALIMYTISYVDRTNISLAMDGSISTMMKELLMDDKMKGVAGGLTNSPLGLANHADARRRPSIALAADMVVLHQRPSPRGEMDFAGGEGIFGRRAAAGSIRPGTGQKSAVVALLSATRGVCNAACLLPAKLRGVRLHDFSWRRVEKPGSKPRRRQVRRALCHPVCRGS